MSEARALSFENLAEELSPPLLGYLRRMVGHSADAEDLLQETLIRISRGLPRFEQRSKARTWAYRIATNVAVDYLRKTGKGRFVEFVDSHEPVDFDEEDRLVLDEMNDCIRGVIDKLPPDYRAALILFNLQGKSVAETAKIVGISVPAAKIRIYRARERLREALNRTCDLYRTTGGDLRCDRKQPD